jgi:dTDP-4-dehydrorhamnose 3,5-epimerase
MPEIVESQVIAGVKFVDLKMWSDERGVFMETFRKEWFPERNWDRVQTNCSLSKAGVLRGLHYHHLQVDYWFVPDGVIRVGLVDLRPGSPTQRASQIIEVNSESPRGIFIPIGVAHGFLAVTNTTLTYLVDNYYDSSDEYGVLWSDPDLRLDWGISDPIISRRDRTNPMLNDIPGDLLPKPYVGNR